MAELEYVNPEDDPRELAVKILDQELAGSFLPDRGLGYAMLAVADRMTVINDTLNDLYELLAEVLRKP
jgi:hypothetical protein